MTDTATLKLMLEHRAAIEAEWQALGLAWLPPGYPENERDALRDAFFAGAQGMLRLLAEVQPIVKSGQVESDWVNQCIAEEMQNFLNNFTLTKLDVEGSA